MQLRSLFKRSAALERYKMYSFDMAQRYNFQIIFLCPETSQPNPSKTAKLFANNSKLFVLFLAFRIFGSPGRRTRDARRTRTGRNVARYEFLLIVKFAVNSPGNWPSCAINLCYMQRHNTYREKAWTNFIEATKRKRKYFAYSSFRIVSTTSRQSDGKTDSTEIKILKWIHKIFNMLLLIMSNKKQCMPVNKRNGKQNEQFASTD